MIKNIIFDIGNVLVRWDPLSVTTQLFSDLGNPEVLHQQLFKSITWMEHNKGKISEAELVQIYYQTLGIDKQRLEILMRAIKESLTPVPGGFELLKDMYEAKFALYALTDNTHEIMSYLQEKYDFWNLFRGVVASNNVGFIKPAAEIYQHLLTTYNLRPAECVFLDDIAMNAQGAVAVSMYGIQFENAEQGKRELQKLLINLRADAAI